MSDPNPNPSNLDFSQCIQRAFDTSIDRLRVDAEITASILPPPGLEVAIDAADDNIAIRNSGNSNELLINSDGSINAVVTSISIGMVSVGVNDKSAFTYGVDKELPVGGVYQDASPTLTAGQTGVNRLTQYRGLHVNLRDNSGNESGILANPLRIDPTGTTTQPVNVTNATLSVTQGTSPWVVSGTVAATQSGSWTTGRTWNLLNTTDSVNIGNFPATQSVTQGTSPWIISGTVTANAGTNLNTSALNLESTQSAFKTANHSDLTTINTTLGSPFQAGGSIGNTSFGASQTGVWSVGRTWNLSFASDKVDASGSSISISNFPATVAVTQSTSPWVVSGTVTSNIGTTGGLALDSSLSTINTTLGNPAQEHITAGSPSSVRLSDGTSFYTAFKAGDSIGNTAFGRTWTLSSGTDSVASVQSGTWTVQQGTPPWSVSQSGSWTVTANAGTNLNTSLLQLDTTGAKLNNAQGSTTSGQTGPLIQGAVTTSAPSYTTAQTSPLSLTTSGALRIDGSGSTQPISGTVTANQGTSPWVISGTVTANAGTGTFLVDGSAHTQPVSGTVAVTQSTSPWVVSGTVTSNQGTSPWVNNITQFGSNNVVTGTGASGVGIPRVTVSNDSNILATQSGTWNIGTLTSITNPVTVAQATAANLNATVVGTGTFAVQAAQSGTWTTGRTWTLSSGTDSVAVTQSTSPWVSNVSQFGGSNVVTGTGTSGAGIPRVTVSNDSNVLATQSGTWTVQQGTPPWSVVGNVASGASDSGDPIKTGAVFNTTLPTVTNGQRVDSQADANGRHLTSNAPLDGYKATYSASIVGLVAATTPTDIFTIYGSGTKTVRVTRILISATQNTSATRDILLIKRSTANTGGTSTNPTIIPNDSNNAAGTATITAYTANPTLGTTVGTIRARRTQILATNVTNPLDPITWDFGIGPMQTIVLRGTSQGLAINLNSVTSSNNLFNITVEWTEE